MSRRIQPAVIFVVCDGCEVVAAPEPLHVLASHGWTVSRDEPTGCDWCPQCTYTRRDLTAAIQRVRELCSDDLRTGWFELREDILRALDGDW